MPPKVRVKIPVHVLVYSIGFFPAAAYGEKENFSLHAILICVLSILYCYIAILLHCHSNKRLIFQYTQPTTGTKMHRQTKTLKKNFPKIILTTYNHHVKNMFK